MNIEQPEQAMKVLDYPADKLQILFLTEEDDAETRMAIRSLHLPAHFSVVIVPDGSPRTKPRACNYGLMLARRLTKNSVASFFGTLLFVASPLLLPVQGMVSGDVLAIASITMTVYAFVTWAESRRLKDVLFTACCISLMTLTCYDGWLLFPLFLVLFFVVSALKQQSSVQREATTIVFGILAGIGMLL